MARGWGLVGSLLLVLLSLELMARATARSHSEPWMEEGRDLRLEAVPEPHRERTRKVFAELDKCMEDHIVPGLYFTWTHPGCTGEFVNTDVQGNRRTVQAGPPGPAPLRVYVFGGSVAWGYGVADEETIASRLAVHLRAALPATPLEVVNFGRLGHVSRQDVIVLLGTLGDSAWPSPDLVILVSGPNDVTSVVTGTNLLPGDAIMGQYAREQMYRLMIRPTPATATVRLLRFSALFKRLFPSAGSPPPPLPAPSPERTGELAGGIARHFLVNAQAAVGAAERRGAHARVYWSPTLFDKPSLTPLEQRAVQGWDPYMAPHGELYRRTSREVAAQLAGRQGLSSMSGLFSTVKEGMFLDAEHYTAEANDRIARHIAEDVRPWAGQRPAQLLVKERAQP